MRKEQEEIATLKALVSDQSEQIFELTGQVSKLTQKIVDLEKELLRYKTPKKDSSNSSIPPSQDPFRIKQTSSLRAKSGKPQGGQIGHQGSTLEMSSSPDVTVKHEPEYCNRCGRILSDIPGELSGKRQVIDIPPILPVITEHQIYRKHCTCGHCTESTYPVEVHSPICYGENVISLTGYLHARQYLPFDRMSEMFRDVFGLSVSSGTLVNLVSRLSARCTPVYEYIRKKLTKSEVVGADETGVCVNGKNQWAWTFQNDKLTYIHIDSSRGRKVIDSIFASGLPRSIMVHDCWKPYFPTDCQTHQICTAHLLRELKYLDKLYNDSWTDDFMDLISVALELKRELRESDYLQPIVQRNILETRLDELLLKPVDSKHKKLLAFKDRMIKYRKYLFTFLYYYNVPPDNNGSERAVRTFKVKQKISGLFRSDKGAQDFAVIRSIIDTAIKNSQNVWAALFLAPKARAE